MIGDVRGLLSLVTSEETGVPRDEIVPFSVDIFSSQ